MKNIVKRYERIFCVIALLFFVPAQSVRCAPPESKNALCNKKAIDKWIGQQLSKQKNRKIIKELNSNKYRVADKDLVVFPAQEIPVKMLGKLPSVKQWEKISGGIRYTRFNVIEVKGNYFVIADNFVKCETTGTQDFYLCKGADYVRVLRLNHVSEKITKIVLDNKGAEFIKTEDNPCSAGWTGALYTLDKDEKLVEVLKLGGLRATVHYMQLLETEPLTVMNAATEYIEDAKLRKTLGKCPGFTGEYFTKPQLSHVFMYKWDGTRFNLFGDVYYHRPE